MIKECRKCKMNQRYLRDRSKCTECAIGSKDAFELIDDLATVENWYESSYEEGTSEEFSFFVDPVKCHAGDLAYVYLWQLKKLVQLEIVKVIKRSEGFDAYDELVRDDLVLVKKEVEYGADTSAEFILENDCWLVWFRENRRGRGERLV